MSLKHEVLQVSRCVLIALLFSVGLAMMACENPATASVSPPPKSHDGCVEERYVEISTLPQHDRMYWEDRVNHWTSKGFVFSRKITPNVDMSVEAVWILSRPCEEDDGS